MVDVLAVYPVVKTRPFFDAMEKKAAGTGGLYSVNIDPWKCTGCLECVDVCGPGALSARRQSSAAQAELEQSFSFLSTLPNTAARFTENALQSGGDSKRLILYHDNYYAMTGGHGACRGCGEVTAIRLLTATNRAIHEHKRKLHVHELEKLIDDLGAKLETVQNDEQDPQRRERMQQTIRTLEQRLYLFEGGPTGEGPSAAAIANAFQHDALELTAYGYMMTRLDIPRIVTESLITLTDNRYVIFLIINAILLGLGMIMDMAPLIVITTPILLPVAASLGVDPVHFGVVLLLNLAIGLCTPPVGSTLFVGCAIGGLRMEEAVRGLWPFYLAMAAILLLVTFVPELSLWLPERVAEARGMGR